MVHCGRTRQARIAGAEALIHSDGLIGPAEAVPLLQNSLRGGPGESKKPEGLKSLRENLG